MNRFGKESDYVVQYLDYLIRVNDDTNAQSVFERAVSTLPVEETKDIWSMYLDYQAAYGDLTALQELEARYLAAFPEETIANRLMEKYSFLDLATVADVDMGMVHREPVPSGEETWKTTSPEDKGPPPAGSSAVGMEPGPVLPTRYDSVGYGAGRETQGSRHASRRQLLASVHPERYPRPDLSQWVPFKAVEEIQRRGTQSSYLGESEEEFDGSGRLGSLKPPLHGAKDGSGPLSGVHSKPPPDYSADHVPSGIRRGRSHSPGPGSGHDVELDTPWDVVDAFLQLLPPASHFTQPVFPVEEIVDRLQQSALPDVDLAHRSSLAAALQVTLTPDRFPANRDTAGRAGPPPPTGYHDHHPGDYRGRDSGPRRGYHHPGSGRGGLPPPGSRFSRGSGPRGRGGPPRGHAGFRGRGGWR
ncbi:mRNA 3'-end-processing protein rna14 [Dispira parvispora]|uniref:mRNA 3'-end-processing protein rna14 n=1 Tax=Dispira parvispora TaxID=1520584 RepID=A0A9W8ASJ9_9FUNG|nr:mRNA 3'-end-processing protein rna14 [Dispira parvispora]